MRSNRDSFKEDSTFKKTRREIKSRDSKLNSPERRQRRDDKSRSKKASDIESNTSGVQRDKVTRPKREIKSSTNCIGSDQDKPALVVSKINSELSGKKNAESKTSLRLTQQVPL
jgi:hypothetical protein